MGTEKRERQKANRQLKLEQIAKEQAKQKTKRRGLQIGLIIGAVVLLTAAVYFLTSSGDDDGEAQSTTTIAATAPVEEVTTTAAPVAEAFSYGTGECAPADGSATRTTDFTEAPALCIDPAKTYTAEVETNKGNFTITFDAANAPGNVNNFINLARFKYYDTTNCHRIIEDFVVQCGRPGGTEAESAPGYTVGDETPTRPYQIGDIAVANTGSPDSGGGQIFIITGERGAALPASYSLIGSVTAGMDDTVAAMAAAADPAADNGVPPLEDITIETITIIEA